MNVKKQAVAVDLKQRSVGMDHSEDSFFVTIQLPPKIRHFGVTK